MLVRLRAIRPLGLVAALVAASVAACGGHGGGKGGGGGGAGDAQDTQAEQDSAEIAADPAAERAKTAPLEFTADYKLRPVDVLIVRDGATRGNPISQRLSDAVPTLASKLWNLASITGSVHVGVFDHVYFNPQKQGEILPQTTTPIADQDLTDLTLNGETLDPDAFAKALQTRVNAAGGRGGSPMPATILTALFAESQKAKGSTVAGLFRKDAYWAVLFVGQSVNPADPLDDRDVLAALKDKASSLSVSALVPDEKGCAVADTTPEQKTVPDGVKPRNLELKMQQAFNGVFGTICGSEFLSFMDAFVNQATGTQYFTVTLPAPVKAEGLKITAAGVDVKEFRYRPGSTTLEISTKIKPGTKFTVSATPEASEADPVVGTDPGDPNVPKPTADKLPPDQEAFLKDVQPAFQRNCAGCHNGRPFNTNGGFASAKTYKDEIKRRLALPDTEAQHMPPKPATVPAADLKIINDWTK